MGALAFPRPALSWMVCPRIPLSLQIRRLRESAPGYAQAPYPHDSSSLLSPNFGNVQIYPSHDRYSGKALQAGDRSPAQVIKKRRGQDMDFPQDSHRPLKKVCLPEDPLNALAPWTETGHRYNTRRTEEDSRRLSGDTTLVSIDPPEIEGSGQSPTKPATFKPLVKHISAEPSTRHVRHLDLRKELARLLLKNTKCSRSRSLLYYTLLRKSILHPDDEQSRARVPSPASNSISSRSVVQHCNSRDSLLSLTMR